MGEVAVSVSKLRLKSARADANGDVLVCAFNEVRAELVSTLFFVLGNQEDAHDAAQDAFLKCWRTRQSLTEVRNIRAWIFRVGLNAAKDLQRSAWRRKSKPLADNLEDQPTGPASLTASPPDQLENKESMERLREALMELRPEEKAVFLLRQNGDLTYEEIAELRQSPVGTVKTQMRSALQKLRRVLKES